jgi:cell cycle sensor histidine kinase DivJ
MRAHRLNGEGEEAVVVAVTRDISEHRDRIEELEALHREAAAASEARAKALAVASHELRTPLNAILGYAELLMARDPSGRCDPRHEYAATIHQAGELMNGVVSTLLDLSAIEAGGCDLSPEPLCVADLLEESCRPLALMAERAGIAIARDVPEDLPELVADRRACQRILLNLLSNAVKYTPRGGLVSVRVRREGDRMVFCVRDTGIGVEPNELARLCDPFYRTSSARGSAQTGSGLGLSVVRGLVALHRGRLALTSIPGEGLCATVTLPLDAGLAPRRAPVPIATRVRPLAGALAKKTG